MSYKWEAGEWVIEGDMTIEVAVRGEERDWGRERNRDRGRNREDRQTVTHTQTQVKVLHCLKITL